MPPTYVALDLETTGLDADRDAIIEVGAVRFDAGGPGETFSTFIDPKRSIPYRIQRLTNITDDDVAGTPQFAEIAADLEAFIGGSPVVGQNIGFDLGFLKKYQLEPPGPGYDTQDLAGLLLPDLLERNLRGIASHLGIDFPVRHRALADADATRQVFVALRARLAALPAALLVEAERIASATDWPLRHLLIELLEDRTGEPAGEAPGLLHGCVRPPQDYGPSLAGGDGEREPIDPQEIETLIAEAGPRMMTDFEERPEQLEMVRAVSSALNNGEHLLVEAGTGVGKSLAYLLPGARFALQNGARIVISTNTINLQEQLTLQDIPLVRRLLGPGAEAEDLRTAQLKGRRNYLCLQRLTNLRRSSSLTPEDAKMLARLLLWLPHTDTGDRAEIRISPSDEQAWTRLSAQNEACFSSSCAFVRDGSCFLMRGRRRAEAAHLLVVNHALLLSDVAVGGGVIPEYDHLVVDEAQHLEDEATDRFGFRAQEGDLIALLDGIATRGGGLVASLRNAARGLASQLPATQELLEVSSQVEDAVGRARERLPDFFQRLAGFVSQQATGGGNYDERLRLTHSIRVQPDWPEVEVAWENLGAALGQVLSSLQRLHTGLQTPDAASLLDHETLLSEAAELVQSAELIRQGVGDIVLRDDANSICWLTRQRSGDGVALSSAPLRVAEILEQRLFSQKETAVLTSATLTVEGRFDFIRQALGLEEANELPLGSPFDYVRSTAVLVPQDMPEPNQTGYMAAVQQALIDLVRASQGRALVLFTSHSSLRAAYEGIKGPLEEEQILVLGHYIDGSPRNLIQALREHPHTVVLGTASFWEGVDVVGEALSLLVMARLPFSVPSDPVFQARSELYDDPFNEYAVPQAALRFKQGFGRLIRRKTDCGVMVVLDGRIHSKAYGPAFLHSLPDCTDKQMPQREMPAFVSGWLGDGA